jgi:hypothetical protein
MGLLGGIARTAVAAGTWTAVSNRVNRRQYNRWSQQEQRQAYPAQQAPAYAAQQAPAYQQPAPPPAAQGRDRIAQLKDLADLKTQGILTEEEFATQKARILAT